MNILKSVWIISCFIVIFCALLFVIQDVQGQDPVPRYIVWGASNLTWKEFDELPFVELRDMVCDVDFCEDFVYAEHPRVINNYYDRLTNTFGDIYTNSSDVCWLWEWQRYHDDEGNPHMARQVVIECPEYYYFNHPE